MDSLPIIKRCLAWEIGSRSRIVLGRNPFIGWNSKYTISISLLQVLNNSNIFSLAQAVDPVDTGTTQNWSESIQIGWSDELKSEWDTFVTTVICSGIRFKNENDKLVWFWNRSIGTVTAKLAYQCILYFKKLEERKWWFKAIWKLNIPTKLIFFTWLCLKDCILTDINYQKSGGIGPTFCNVCLMNEETTTHAFVECPKSQQIWTEVIKFLKIENNWNFSYVE